MKRKVEKQNVHRDYKKNITSSEPDIEMKPRHQYFLKKKKRGRFEKAQKKYYAYQYICAISLGYSYGKKKRKKEKLTMTNWLLHRIPF